MIVHVCKETANGLGKGLRQFLVVRKMVLEHGCDPFFFSPVNTVFFDLHPPTSIFLCNVFGNKAGVVLALLTRHILVA